MHWIRQATGYHCRFKTTQGTSAGITNLLIPGVMVSNQWHQIAVVYTPSNTAIYVDGTALGSGAGLTNIIPPQAILDQGFYIGTDTSGCD